MIIEQHSAEHIIHLEETRTRESRILISPFSTKGSTVLPLTWTELLQSSLFILKYGTTAQAFLKYGPGPTDYIIFKRT